MSLLQNNNLFKGVDLDNPLQSASKSISDAMSGFSDQLINPLKNISESVSSGVALIGEKDSMLTKALTTFKSINIEKIQSGVTDMIGGILNSPDLGSILTYEDGFKIDTDGLMRIASQGLGYNIGGIADIKSQLGQGFLDELNSMTGGLASGLYFDDGMKLRISDGWEMGAIDTLTAFLGKSSPAFAKIQNLAGVNSILNTMLKQAAQNGMYQTFDQFRDEYLFASDYVDAIINSLEYCIGKGDIQSINKIFEIITTDGLHVVRAKYPDLIERMLANFTFSSETNPEDYTTLGNLLKTLCELVGGTNWHLYQTEFGPAVNLITVSLISDDAKLLLSDYPEYCPFLCASGIYQETDAKEHFLSQFPNAIAFED